MEKQEKDFRKWKEDSSQGLLGGGNQCFLVHTKIMLRRNLKGNGGSASTNSYFFLRYLIWRPPCATLPLPLLRDMVQTGFDSSECIDARAWKSKYRQNKNLLFTGVTELTNESVL